MSTAFLKSIFSSSSQRPTANTWNSGTIGNNTIGLDFPSSVAFGGTLYVAVGVGGYTSGFPIKYTTPTKIKYTTNFSSTWSSPATNLNDINFTRVRFLNGRFIALGRKASPDNSIYVCFSTDGANWTTSTILPALISGLDYPTDIAWNGSHYVMGQRVGGYVYRSADLITWARTALSGTSLPTFTAITYGAGLFVAMADRYYAYTSPDGVTWTERTVNLSSNNGWKDIVYANSKFVACGGNNLTISPFAVSSDGITWATYSSPSAGIAFNGITYGVGKYIAVGVAASAYGSIINTSSDGITWTPYTISFAYLQSVTYDGTTIFAIGNTSYYVTSTNTTTWTVSSPDIPGYLYATTSGSKSTYIGPGNSISVIVGAVDLFAPPYYATVLYSYDNIAWTPGTITNAGAYGSTVDAGDVVYSNGTFVADNGLRSDDGINWTAYPGYINGPTTTTSVTNLLYKTAGYNIYRSTDNGFTWSINFINGTNSPTSPIFGSGNVVACVPITGDVLVNIGLSGTWNTYATGIYNPQYIAYGGGKFYILSKNSTSTGYNYAMSTDGTSWTSGTATLPITPTPTTGFINALYYKNGLYIATVYGDPAYILTSTDGITYTVRLTTPVLGANSFLRGLASSPTSFVACGWSGTTTKYIYYSDS